MKQHFGKVWQAVPSAARKAIVLVIGLSIVLLGLALIVLPGPFTLPLLILGFIILGSEFAWAASVLARTKKEMARATEVAKKATNKITGKINGKKL